MPADCRIGETMISVAMTTYNGAQYIIEQLESIRLQTRKVDEIVVVDDGSCDDTLKLVRDYMDKYPECGIRLEQNEINLGYKKNFQKAISLCQGDITFLCDQDDCWFEDKVEKMCGVLEEHPQIGVLSSAFIQMDGAGKKGERKSAYQRKMDEGELVCVPIEDLIFHNISQGCAMAMRKDIKDTFLKQFDESIPHDWIINVIAGMKKKCYYWNVPMFFYRIHDNNTIGLNDNITLKKKNTMEVRVKDARQSLSVLAFIEKVDSVFYNENSWLTKAKGFSLNHVKNLEQRRFVGLLFQNFHPCYRKLKTFRGRMLDLFFVLNK